MITQRLVNRFPLETKIRIDPSSLGARLYSVWGEYFDFAYAENKRILNDKNVLKHGLSYGHLYQIVLDETNLFQYTTSIGGTTEWIYPTVSGTAGLNTYALDKVDSLEELFSALPDRLTLYTDYGIDNISVYESSDNVETYNHVVDHPEQLMCYVYDSTNYYKKTGLRNVRASGKHYVILNGYDINGIAFTEYINTPDDGYYRVQNIVKEITSVVVEGSDASVLLAYPGRQDYILDEYHTAIDIDVEGNTKLRRSFADSKTMVTFFTDIVKEGEEYRDGSPELEGNEKEIWEAYLQDYAGNNIEIIDIAINPNDLRTYGLSFDGNTYCWDLKPSAFSPPARQSDITHVSSMDIIATTPWARYNETMKLYTRFTRMRAPIEWVVISVRDPGGTTSYLQADKTWGVSEYRFIGQSTQTLPENSWIDFSFENLFDSYGQWEFYINVKPVGLDQEVAYTGVMVDAISALAALELGITNPYSIYFSHDDKLVIVSTDNHTSGKAYSAYAYDLNSDVYIPDEVNNILYFKEEYDSVEVVT